jgi:lipopolysaccharide transport system ATP-binding protein
LKNHLWIQFNLEDVKTVIEVEHLSKIYRLGEVGSGTISRDINAWWARINGKENPNLRIDQISKIKESEAYHHALSDVSFEVKEGEVVGIIGRNGAGKSTLLKVLSRVTTPTEGSFKVKGRIASLLEVGTGFNPDLSGRDNIFLNGAILGMKRAEITKKFDEIVDFSGVEKFIDTPVKRYSSGMYVRLAFAVAAHLDPEILVVDEVLAVGDVEFQNKCLGKMSEVSKSGRTILFVSHNMQAVAQLCSRGILFESGKIAYNGSVQEAIKQYLMKSTVEKSADIDLSNWKERSGNGDIQLSRIQIYNGDKISNRFMIGEDLRLKVYIKSREATRNVKMALHFYRYDETIIANVENIDADFIFEPFTGEKCFEITFPGINFYPDTYKVGITIATSDWGYNYDKVIPCFEFVVQEGSPLVKRKLSLNGGFIYMVPQWKTS